MTNITEGHFENIDFPIGKNIRILMERMHLSEADLCRGINVPQTTINRLLSCQTNDPRISTLYAIAKFFDITIEELMHLDPSTTGQLGQTSKGSVVPLLPWEKIASWFARPQATFDQASWIKTEQNLNPSAFALKIPTSLHAFFGGPRILLIDACEANLIQDTCYVLLSMDGTNFCLRQLIRDAKQIFLKKLFAPFELSELTDPSSIKGQVVEIRHYPNVSESL